MTIAAEGAVAVVAFLVLRLAARQFGPDGFGEFVTARRALALVQLPLLVGAGISLPRFIALEGQRTDRRAASRFLVAGLVLGLGPSLLVALLISLAPGISARILFEDRALQALSIPVALGLVGLSANTITTAALRGRFAIGLANLLQFTVMGILPLAVFATRPATAAEALWLQGILATLIAGAAWTALLVSAIRSGALADGVPGQAMRQLCHFGLPRVPGEFALVALFSLPPLIVLRSGGLTSAGHLSFALSILTLFGTGFAPIGLVLLPVASRLTGLGDVEGLRRLAYRLLWVGVPLAGAGVFLGWLLARWFTLWYLGAEFEAAVPLVRLALLGVVPYVIYILYRNLLDAMDVRPVNSRNLLVALVVALLPSLWWRSAEALLMALTAGLLVLGGLTAVALWARVRTASWTDSGTRKSQ
jgi:O-antigen/teichoic acid export membrane protein